MQAASCEAQRRLLIMGACESGGYDAETPLTAAS